MPDPAEAKPSHLTLISADQAAPDISLSNFSAWYGESRILNNICLSILPGQITCIVGPSGSGKTTLIRCLNRINDDVPGFQMRGDATILGQNLAAYKDVTRLRAAVGMVFQMPCVFAGSITDNVLFGVKHKRFSRLDRAALTEDCLRKAVLWTDVSHRLTAPAATLSQGQKQRLCMARALAADPKILLMDEPTASVDPQSAREIEGVIQTMKADRSIVMVTHDIRQARRIADTIIFMCDGQIIEAGSCAHMTSSGALPKTQTYLSENFCDC